MRPANIIPDATYVQCSTVQYSTVQHIYLTELSQLHGVLGDAFHGFLHLLGIGGVLDKVLLDACPSGIIDGSRTGQVDRASVRKSNDFVWARHCVEVDDR